MSERDHVLIPSIAARRARRTRQAVRLSTVAGASLAVLGLFVLTAIVHPALALQSGPTPVPRATEDMLGAAQSALAQAQNALGQVNQLNGQVSLILGFIQAVGVIGGILAALIGLGFGVTGLRTINEYRGELARARDELGTMKAQLAAATAEAGQVRKDLEAANEQQVQMLREQATAAYRALGLLQIGEQQVEMGNLNAAMQMYWEAHELNPDNQITNYMLGELFLIERDIPNAIKYLERARELGPTMAPVYAAIGLAHRLQGDKIEDQVKRNQAYVQAEQLLLKAVEINHGVRDVNKESVYSTLGSLYRREGRLDDAISAYQVAEKITPNSSYPLINLGQLYFMRGELDKASEQFARVLPISLRKLEAFPTDVWARFDVLTAQLALGQTTEALQQLEVTLRQTHSIGPLETLLDGLRNLKQSPQPPAGIDEAIAQVDQVIREYKPNAKASG
jgi:tetratricopeptide (TPR) repeat protein